MVKNRQFEPTPPLFVAMTPLEFRRDLWRQKTRFPGLSYGVVCVILYGLAILVEHRLVTDRKTDRHTMTASTALA